MKETRIIEAAMKTCGWTQKTLAEKMGYVAQSCVASRLRGGSMRVDTFVKMLSLMGYKVVVESTSPNANKNKWEVSLEDSTNEDEE